MSVLSGNPSTTDGCASGPLRGVKVIEIASIGPGPFAAMLLADLGAEVVRIDRSGGAGNPLGEGSWNFMHRGRRSAAVDLKHPDGRDLVLRLCASADALIEGFRPGVMEKLGLECTVTQGGEEKMHEFSRAANILKRRIEFLISLPLAKLDRLTLQQKVRDIGTE